MFDTLKTIDASTLKSLFPRSDHKISAKKPLDKGLAVRTRQLRRAQRVVEQPRLVAEHIGSLPAMDECLTLVMTGTYPGAAFIPAMAQLAGEPIRELHLSTLSFNPENIDLLDRMVTDKQLLKVSIIACRYFAAESINGKLYRRGVEFAKKWGFRLVAVQNHSKLHLYRFQNRRFVISSSGNLRSSHCIEQADIVQCPTAGDTLYSFHRAWMERILEEHQS